MNPKKKFLSYCLQLLNAFHSSDRPTRLGAYLFLFSSIATLFTIGLQIDRLWEQRIEKIIKNRLNFNPIHPFQNQIKTPQPSHPEKLSEGDLIALGEFIINFHDPTHKSSPEKLPLATLDISLACRPTSVCETIKKLQLKINNSITDLLVGWTKEEFFSPAGKSKLKTQIKLRLNAILSTLENTEEENHSKTLEVYFTKILAN